MKAISGKELVDHLRRNGWILKRIQGSHHIFMKPGENVRISVPVHGNKPMKKGLQKHLMKMAGIQSDDL
jgi:predicted RNA binding protein YcfA (HicA-like mRNA interferase family)